MATNYLNDCSHALAALVKYCAGNALSKGAVSGLAAMMPSGGFIHELNLEQPGQPKPNEVCYYAVTSHFEVEIKRANPKEFTRRCLQWLKGGFVASFMHEPSDLVVNESAMAEIDPAVGNFFKSGGLIAMGSNPFIHHTNYFFQEQIVEKLWNCFASPMPQAPFDARTKVPITVVPRIKLRKAISSKTLTNRNKF